MAVSTVTNSQDAKAAIEKIVPNVAQIAAKRAITPWGRELWRERWNDEVRARHSIKKVRESSVRYAKYE